jgi:hemolysin activation/secretion protein
LALAGAAALLTSGSTLVLAQDRSGTAASPHAEAALTLGRGQAAGRRFNQAALDLGYQRFVGAFQRVDLRLRAQGVGSAAPASEWVAFGGEDWVRGMRSEALLAQRAVALQAEYWWPWPVAADSAAIARLLRRNLALALLADVGRVSPALPLQRRQHAAVGLGLRFTQRVGAQRLTLKLDIAQPVAVDGALPAADRRARLHFSVGTQRSL